MDMRRDCDMVCWGAAYRRERFYGFFTNDFWTAFADFERIKMSGQLNTGALDLRMVCWFLGAVGLEMMIDEHRKLMESEQ